MLLAGRDECQVATADAERLTAALPGKAAADDERQFVLFVSTSAGLRQPLARPETDAADLHCRHAAVSVVEQHPVDLPWLQPVVDDFHASHDTAFGGGAFP